MRALLIEILIVVLAGNLLPATAQSKPQIRVKIGTEKQIVKDKLALRFLDMVEDSRCPRDVQCIWAGNAKIKVQISKPGGQPKIFEMNTSLDPQSILVEGYTIKLIGLTPEPASNIRIRKDGYVATFSVEK